MSHFLYTRLSQPEYGDPRRFNTRDLGEGMELIEESVAGWWKPRYLVDHRAGEAYEFLNIALRFAIFSEDDVDWECLKWAPQEARENARRGFAGYPTHVGLFKDGIARVSWQLNPDGRYYRDEDGFGMTDDEEVTLYGTIDRTGKVVEKYRIG